MKKEIREINILYTEIPSFKEDFKKYLSENINFRTKNEIGTIRTYICRLTKISNIIKQNTSNEEFDIFCFYGNPNDIYKIYHFTHNHTKEKFIKDTNSPINLLIEYLKEKIVSKK
ncbi:hypothetical protein [Helicobacter sp. MIT 14-3879]|uniref:hypothetical protein n=1 Tax=Helicobacter sp. MIT 14-3879 TaxID=2040649 RepID=UPI000E1F95A1|nr:hypothetical protein [Helicobacter sp. MIT 14-3879]RDU65643.1 hypothetical protein CQA44_01290 [Helicobacter sp. MIT 14-3879]